jgi:hypothetical protein
METVRRLWDWLVSLDPTFQFLLALPLIVAVSAFVGDYVRRFISVRAQRPHGRDKR